jgi:hypothetical protein
MTMKDFLLWFAVLSIFLILSKGCENGITVKTQGPDGETRTHFKIGIDFDLKGEDITP